MKWIDVNDRLPEKDIDEPVLFFSKNRGVKVGGLNPWSSKPTWGDWTDIDRDGRYEVYFSHEVTHWMPLPEPPKK